MHFQHVDDKMQLNITRFSSVTTLLHNIRNSQLVAVALYFRDTQTAHVYVGIILHFIWRASYHVKTVSALR